MYLKKKKNGEQVVYTYPEQIIINSTQCVYVSLKSRISQGALLLFHFPYLQERTMPTQG